MLFHHPLRGFWAVLLLFFGLLAPAAAQRDEGAYQILGARYGTVERNVDVTERLRQLARSDRGFRVSNDVFGVDPDHGRTKALRIYARGPRGETRTFEYREDSFVDGSEFTGWRGGNWGPGQGPGAGRDDGDLRILRAFYGTPEQHVDVTQRLRELARRDRAIPLTNDTFGVDPHPYRTKTLRIYVRTRDGQTQVLEYTEGKTIDGARFAGWSGGDWGREAWNGGWNGAGSPGGYPGGGYGEPQRYRLEILNATYGANGRLVDVSGALRSMVRDNRLYVRATNELCGNCDPAPRVTKTLRVTYSAGGRNQQASVREGDYLQIP